LRRIPLSAKYWYFALPCLNKNPSHMHLVWGSRIRRRGSYCTVRILCESGVRIKICGSGFKNPHPYLFALLLIQCADPDQVWIRIYMHFAFLKIFDGSRSEDPVLVSHLIQQLSKKFLATVLINI
jgi:hypothetical protein